MTGREISNSWKYTIIILLRNEGDEIKCSDYRTHNKEKIWVLLDYIENVSRLKESPLQHIYIYSLYNIWRHFYLQESL